tara:strand:- start:3309 stop:3611 length:303 start_codon:yes stop_codon:yes gene_type:complete
MQDVDRSTKIWARPAMHWKAVDYGHDVLSAIWCANTLSKCQFYYNVRYRGKRNGLHLYEDDDGSMMASCVLSNMLDTIFLTGETMHAKNTQNQVFVHGFL